jgi:hypothetical protein
MDDDLTGTTATAHPAVTALATVDAGVAELAGANLWSMSEHELLSVRVDAEATRGRLESVVLGMTREIDGRGAALRAGASSTAAWLRGACRQRPAIAHNEVRLAAELDRDLPALAAAVAAGQVSYESARVIAATIRQLPAAVDAATRARGEAFLVEQARHYDAAAVPTLGRHLIERLDPAGAAELEAEESRREEAEAFTVSHDWHGGRRVTGRFTPEHGATLDAALQVLAAPRPGPDGEPDPRSPEKRRADALMQLIAWGLASEQMPTCGGEPVTITVITTPGHLQAENVDQPAPDEPTAGDEPAGDEPAEDEPAGDEPAGDEPALDGVLPREDGAFLEDGTPLSPEATRRLGCDAWLQAAIIDSAGALLDIGRSSRIVPSPLRRALIVRDGGCAFPGCGRPARWCHAHHIWHARCEFRGVLCVHEHPTHSPSTRRPDRDREGRSAQSPRQRPRVRRGTRARRVRAHLAGSRREGRQAAR